MANFTRIFPSAVVPGLLASQVQDVDFKKYIGKETHYGELDKAAIYVPTLTNINTNAEVSQTWQSELTNQSYTLGQIKAPFYNITAYYEYDPEQQKTFHTMTQGVSLHKFLMDSAEQAINQRRREAVLFGFDTDGDLSQGILANGVSINLPADTAGATTLTAYNPAELQQFLASVIRDARSTSYGMLNPTIITSTPRVISYLKSVIVSLAQSQQKGAGVDTVAGLLGRVVNWMGGGEVEFVENESLRNDTTGDRIVFIAKGLDPESQKVNKSDSQNIIGGFNSITYNTWFDGAFGLAHKQNPEINGIISGRLIYRMTPGVTLRPEAVRILTAKYV